MTKSQANISTLLPLFFVLIIETMSFGVIFPVLGPMFLEHTATIVDPSTSLMVRQILYGVTLSIFSVAMLFGAPVLGDLSDRWGRRNVILTALLGSAVGLGVCAIAIDLNNMFLLICGRIIGGFFAGSQTIAQAAIADISTKENKTVNMSMIVFACCIGFIIGPIFGGYFADKNTFTWSTYATPFYAAGILTILNALMAYVMFKETYKIEVQEKINWFRGVKVFREAFRNKQIRLISVVAFLSELGWSIFFLYLTLFLVKQYNFSGVDVGHYMSVLGVVWAITLIGIVRVIVHYLKAEAIVSLSLFLYGFFIFFYLIHNVTLLWALVVPIGIGSSLSYSALVTVFSNAVDEVAQGWVMGISSSVMAMAWGIGGVSAGLLGGISDELPIIIGAIVTLAAGSLMLVVTRRR